MKKIGMVNGTRKLKAGAIGLKIMTAQSGTMENMHTSQEHGAELK